jgi:hypothetical protein
MKAAGKRFGDRKRLACDSSLAQGEPPRPFDTRLEPEPPWLRDALAPPPLSCELPLAAKPPIAPREWSLDP